MVVLSQVFPARPSSIPEIRNFVRHCLAESPLTEEGTREVGETVFRALLDAAGPTGSINVAFRIFPEHVEVDVLHSDSQLPEHRRAAGGQRPAGRWPRPGRCLAGASAGREPGRTRLTEAGLDQAREAATTPSSTVGSAGQVSRPPSPSGCRSRSGREGLTQEAAARQLGVSVKTVSRWVGGTTEPRMRDLRRIQEVFGTLPSP